MASKNPPSPRYILTARTPEGLLQQTRASAASAFALAQLWVANGYESVIVTDPTGCARGASGYQGEAAERLRLARGRG